MRNTRKMRRLLPWLVGFAAAFIAPVVLALAFAWIVDAAVVRNMLAGPPMGVVTQTQLNNPKEPVPGTERDDIALAAPDAIDPEALQAAERYAGARDSVALLVWQGGALRYEKYWPGFSASTVTDPFSAHKTVMALLMGAAIADGYVKSVDEPVARYLPQWRDDERRNIRIRDALQMSSGLAVPRFPGWTSLRITAGSDLRGVVTTLPAEKPPGTDFQYSNANSQVLGLVIQEATGQRYANYLSERLWSRLGAPTAHVWLDREQGVPRTFCCLYTTARSWLRVGLLILNQGRVGDQQVIPADWIRAMTTPAPTNPNYGYQIWLGSPDGTQRRYNDKTVKAFHSERFVADDVMFIDGFGGQRVYIVPSRDLIIVRTGRAQLEWDDAVIPNAILRGLRTGRTSEAAT